MTAFNQAAERYREIGVDVEKALQRMDQIAISLHCWQGDDVQGFENSGALDGGIAVTGNYPGRASNGDELRADLDFALHLLPGGYRLNLHAIYGESTGKPIERNQIAPEHFARFIDWAKERDMGLDFNPTFFSHPMASGGMTLSSPDAGVRDYWIEHGIACRKVAEVMGKSLGKCCITNFWMPDGYKDTPANRLAPRQRMAESLDKIFAVPIDQSCNRDAVESKLFGIGSESYVTGSHEFFMGYAMSRQKMLCLDSGHFHPTETISDKLSSILLFLPEVLLHVSRGVRWDSDHVTVLNDDLRGIAGEVVRHGWENRVHIGLDYFDASINRIAAWVIGARAMRQALLEALLEPTEELSRLESAGDFTARLALQETQKTLPFGAIWEEYCLRHDVDGTRKWLQELRAYESKIQSKR